MKIVTFILILFASFISHLSTDQILENSHVNVRQTNTNPSKRRNEANQSLLVPRTLPRDGNEIPPLSSLPQADDQKIVADSKLFTFDDAFFPFNPGMAKRKSGEGYLLFFRDYVPGPCAEMFKEKRIGIALLNEKFDKIAPVFFPPLPYKGEDARSFWVGEDLYILYYSSFNRTYYTSSPCLVKMNPETLTPEKVYGYKDMLYEKNWIPLVPSCTEERKSSSILTCVRSLYPLDLLYINLDTGSIEIAPKSPSPRSAPPHWKWGAISGGTPAEIVDNVYLGFFHSWYRSKEGKRVYVMGAYTLDSTPPYRMRSMSPYPIVFKDLYQGKAQNLVGCVYFRAVAKGIDRVIFPMGFCVETKEDGIDLIHVACGENDNMIRIITFHKKELLKSLIKVK